MVYTAAQEFLHRKKAHGWTEELLAEYKGLSHAEKDELRVAAKNEPRPILKIVEDLRKHKFSFTLLTITDSEQDMFVSKNISEKYSEIAKPADDIALIVRTHCKNQRVKLSANAITVGNLAEHPVSDPTTKDVFHSRQYIHQCATKAFHAAGCTGMIPWKKIMRDSTSASSNNVQFGAMKKYSAPGFFQPSLTSPHSMSASECQQTMQKLKDLKFVMHVYPKVPLDKPNNGQVIHSQSQPIIHFIAPLHANTQTLISLFPVSQRQPGLQLPLVSASGSLPVVDLDHPANQANIDAIADTAELSPPSKRICLAIDNHVITGIEPSSSSLTSPSGPNCDLQPLH